MKKKLTKRRAVPAQQDPIIRQGDKAAFVRNLPRSTPASIIKEKAAERGMTISVPYVHNIRSAANAKSKDILKKVGKPVVKGTRAHKEKVFRELVITLGPSRAKQLLAQCEVALAQESK